MATIPFEAPSMTPAEVYAHGAGNAARTAAAAVLQARDALTLAAGLLRYWELLEDADRPDWFRDLEAEGCSVAAFEGEVAAVRDVAREALCDAHEGTLTELALRLARLADGVAAVEKGGD